MADIARLMTYLADNHVVSVCSARNNIPWAASCFYAFDADTMALVMMSEESTRHGQEWALSSRVAGTISAQDASVAHLRGIQFTGDVHRLTGGAAHDGAHALYVKRFPIARLHSAPLWVLRLETVKMTDNTMGFGRKIHWQRETP